MIGRRSYRSIVSATLSALLVVSLLSTPAAADDYDGRMAYIRLSEDGWSYELVTAGFAGGNRTVPLDRPALSRPAISPDGTRLAFISPITDGTDGRFALYVANTDGTNIQRLTTSQFADYDPAWSPDGSRLAVSRDTSGSLDRTTCCVLRIVAADGTGSFTVPGTRGGINPAWSPDGSEIAYEAPDGVWVTNLDGTERRRITGRGGAQPAWSPDGKLIAYLAPLANGWELVTRRPNGGSRTVRLTTSFELEAPTFAPDSETLYYVRYRGEGYDGRTLATLWRHHPDEGARAVYSDLESPMILTSVMLRKAEKRSCDTNGDGLAELAIGAPADDDAVVDGGAVVVLDGTASGPAGGTQWHRDLPGVPGTAEADDEFGAAVTCGDFNGDGYSDLVIGAPGDGSGSITVLPGSVSGLSTSGAALWTQSSPGLPGSGGAGDRWGAALATGDVNGDGFDDLAVGAPGTGGSVSVIYGSTAGLSASASQLWNAGALGLGASLTDRLGASVAIGDLNGDGYGDLVIGIPGSQVGTKTDAGRVAVISGRNTGLDAGSARTLSQDTPGVAGIAHSGDELGASVATGDLDGDGFDDLVAGGPGAGHGGINVLYGSSAGESTSGDQVWKQNSPGIAGIGHGTDRFGTSVSIGDIDGDGIDDVAIGVPGTGPGAVNVIYGSSSGLTAAGNQIWKQNTPGIVGVAHAGDAFGTSVSLADYNGDGRADLAVGAPGNGPGAVNVLFGSPGAGLTNAGDLILKQGFGATPGTPTFADRHGFAVR